MFRRDLVCCSIEEKAAPSSRNATKFVVCRDHCEEALILRGGQTPRHVRRPEVESKDGFDVGGVERCVVNEKAEGTEVDRG